MAYTKRITKERADALFEIYLKDPRVYTLVNKGGINNRTASRLINHGYPSRGIEAFKDRTTEGAAEMARQVVQSIHGASLELARGCAMVGIAELVTQAREQMAGWKRMAEMAEIRMTEELSQDDVKVGFLMRAYKDYCDANKKHVECLQMLLGMEAPGQPKSERDEAFAGWTDEEYKEFKYRGIWPARVPKPDWMIAARAAEYEEMEQAAEELPEPKDDGGARVH
jgi:hypothetical protein